MLPLKDNLPPGRVPVVTLALIAIDALACVVFGVGAILFVAASVWLLWIFGGSIEEALGRVRYVAFCVAGGAAAGAAELAVDASDVATVAAAGAIAAVLGGHLVLFPRAKVLTVVLIPFMIGIVEVPALAILALWFPLALAGLGAGGFLTQLAGFAVGLALVKALAGSERDAGVHAY